MRVNGLSAYRTTASFTFEPKVAVFSVSPLAGSQEGGTLVTVRGDKFVDSSALLCMFGVKKVPALYVDAQTMQCLTPPHVPGEVPVRVTSNDGDFLSDSVGT